MSDRPEPTPEQEPPPAPEPQPEPEPTPDPAPEAARGDRRLAHLRVRASEETRRREQAERELAALRELLAQQQGQQPAAHVDQQQVRAMAEQMLAEHLVAEKRSGIINAGVTAYGLEAWNDKTATVHSMGAMGRPEFMEALMDMPNAHEVVAHLADDPDALAGLLGKRPAAMAAALGHLGAELDRSQGRKPTNQISRVPPPIKPVGGGRTAPPPDPTKMTEKEYIQYRNLTAPKKLGGQGKAA